MKKALLWIFKDFRFARKKIGGIWFLIRGREVSGFASAYEYWTQEKPSGSDWDEIAREDYN